MRTPEIGEALEEPEHRREHYEEGVLTLCDDTDLPGVAALERHSRTHLIGGLGMEYARESSPGPGVATRSITQGDPFDEGRFYEHDRNLEPAGRCRVEEAALP